MTEKTTQDGAANAKNGQSLRDIRVALGLSVRKFAEELSKDELGNLRSPRVHAKTITRWEAANLWPTEKAVCDRLDILTGVKRSDKDKEHDAAIAAAARELVFRLSHVDAQEITLRLPDRSTAPADYIEQVTAEVKRHLATEAQEKRKPRRTRPD